MTFQQAKDKLKEIAAGRYHSIEYKLTQYSEKTGGEQFPECTVYIDGMNHHKGTTWDEAFTALDRKMNGIEIDPEEAPDFETVEIIDGPRPCVGNCEGVLCGCYEEA